MHGRTTFKLHFLTVWLAQREQMDGAGRDLRMRIGRGASNHAWPFRQLPECAALDHSGDFRANGADEHGAERLEITSDDDNEFNEVLNSATRQFVNWNARSPTRVCIPFR